ncbi:MAG: hypothetical protein Q9226_000987 [Calogaya cf. arnoldii]
MESKLPPTVLLDLLKNHLILSRVVPFLPPSALLSLAGASRSFYSLVFVTHSNFTFRHLDLSTLPCSYDFGHPSRNVESDEDYLAAPARRAFYVLKKKSVLSCVTTLILDGISVPATLLWEIFRDDASNVRILSIRDVKKLQDEKLRDVLQHLIRPSRPAGSPKLKALYYFTHTEPALEPNLPTSSRQSIQETPQGVTDILGSQLGQCHISERKVIPSWTNGQGVLFNAASREPQELWLELIEACKGLITFDTIICHHAPDSSAPPRLANIALGPDGCQKCHSAREQPRVFGQTPSHDLPLLSPPPLFASTLKAAQCPAPGENTKFFARCTRCLADRRCESCNVWWCEDCYTPPVGGSKRVRKAAGKIKVHMGLCVQECLVQELYTGAGEGGMWG